MPNVSSQPGISLEKCSELELKNRLAHAAAFKKHFYAKLTESIDGVLREALEYANKYVTLLERQAFHELHRREAVAQIAVAEESLAKLGSNKASPGATEQEIKLLNTDISSAKSNIELHERELALAMQDIEAFISNRSYLTQCLTLANMLPDDELRPPAAVQNTVRPDKPLTAKQRVALTQRQRSAEFRAFVAEWWGAALIEKDSLTFDNLLQLATQLDQHKFRLTVLPKSQGNSINKYNLIINRNMRIVSFVDFFKACMKGVDGLPNLRWLRLYLSNTSRNSKKRASEMK